MRIWSTGCSWTYGTGLKDPSNQTYDSHIMRYVCNVGNNYIYKYSDAGHSNQYIFRTAIEIAEKMNKEEDVLLVQWSSPFRQELVSKSGSAFYAPFEFVSLKFLYGLNQEKYNSLGPKNVNIDDFRKMEEDKYLDTIKKYSKLFMNETYMELMSYNMQICLYHLLKSIGVKSLQFYGWDACKIESKNIWEIIPENEYFLKETFGGYTNTVGIHHPNKEAHEMWANFLLKKLQEFKYI